ncbi:phosphopentomutase [Clostridium punense]|uniref:Phosphopentomutase n=1 Tax=Clostridium punense TaxID=1054297 RepID=A0ABS4K755_9CLOT|nr:MULTISPECIES: phosphopentomutase [Clostridium]EQB86683.1 phosphopentomutase [Clostridium sp. BL8]MBP2023615.1 phosphopentomutase [Clostridium punense]
MKRKVTLIVLDSVGIGELPDAKSYGDEGSNTLGNIAKAVKDFKLPNLERIGLGNIDEMVGFPVNNNATGAYGRCAELSKGKDTITGHWEIAGVILETPLNTYPNGFPQEIIEEFENKIGRKTLGNVVASGTAIIDDLGEEHMRTGYPIIYTSADSVFQIAAHEEIISIDELYKMCEIAREMLVGDKMVGRVIARPFIGSGKGNFTRTSNRHDYAIEPFSKTMLEYISEANQSVMAVGKIKDIYTGKGVTDSITIKNNMDGVEKTLEFMRSDKNGLIFSNLVDFDMKYGHRNDVEGYANALIEFDNRLPEIISALGENDILMITADHGCDPTTESTDHSREYIPVLVYGKNIKENANIGTRSGFSDIGKTILDLLEVENELAGESFAKLIQK